MIIFVARYCCAVVKNKYFRGHTPVIPAVPDADTGRSQVQSQPQQKGSAKQHSETLSLNLKINK